MFFRNIFGYFCCRSPYGERGLKLNLKVHCPELESRSPYGERGLKCLWVMRHGGPVFRRSPYGERGLKYFCQKSETGGRSRSPYGERGLK